MKISRCNCADLECHSNTPCRTSPRHLNCEWYPVTSVVHSLISTDNYTPIIIDEFYKYIIIPYRLYFRTVYISQACETSLRRYGRAHVRVL